MAIEDENKEQTGLIPGDAVAVPTLEPKKKEGFLTRLKNKLSPKPTQLQVEIISRDENKSNNNKSTVEEEIAAGSSNIDRVMKHASGTEASIDSILIKSSKGFPINKAEAVKLIFVMEIRVSKVKRVSFANISQHEFLVILIDTIKVLKKNEDLIDNKTSKNIVRFYKELVK